MSGPDGPALRRITRRCGNALFCGKGSMMVGATALPAGSVPAAPQLETGLVCSESALERLGDDEVAALIAARFDVLLGRGWSWRVALLLAARTDLALP